MPLADAGCDAGENYDRQGLSGCAGVVLNFLIGRDLELGRSDDTLRESCLAVIAALVGWFAWAFLIYVIGTKLLPEPQTHADVGQLLRTTGFSAAPGLLRVLGIIPLLGPVIMLIIAIWMLVAMIIAVRQA